MQQIFLVRLKGAITYTKMKQSLKVKRQNWKLQSTKEPIETLKNLMEPLVICILERTD